MKTLTIEHLAAYLPYEVEFYVEDAKGKQLQSWTLDIYTELKTVLGYQNKLILKPLSDLKYGNHTIELGGIFNQHNADNLIEALINDTNHSMSWREWLEAKRYLLKNHFDIFGLIDAGLAVDINTINQVNR